MYELAGECFENEIAFRVGNKDEKANISKE